MVFMLRVIAASCICAGAVWIGGSRLVASAANATLAESSSIGRHGDQWMLLQEGFHEVRRPRKKGNAAKGGDGDKTEPVFAAEHLKIARDLELHQISGTGVYAWAQVLEVQGPTFTKRIQMGVKVGKSDGDQTVEMGGGVLELPVLAGWGANTAELGVDRPDETASDSVRIINVQCPANSAGGGMPGGLRPPAGAGLPGSLAAGRGSGLDEVRDPQALSAPLQQDEGLGALGQDDSQAAGTAGQQGKASDQPSSALGSHAGTSTGNEGAAPMARPELPQGVGEAVAGAEAVYGVASTSWLGAELHTSLDRLVAERGTAAYQQDYCQLSTRTFGAFVRRVEVRRLDTLLKGDASINRWWTAWEGFRRRDFKFPPPKSLSRKKATGRKKTKKATKKHPAASKKPESGSKTAGEGTRVGTRSRATRAAGRARLGGDEEGLQCAASTKALDAADQGSLKPDHRPGALRGPTQRDGTKSSLQRDRAVQGGSGAGQVHTAAACTGAGAAVAHDEDSSGGAAVVSGTGKGAAESDSESDNGKSAGKGSGRGGAAYVAPAYKLTLMEAPLPSDQHRTLGSFIRIIGMNFDSGSSAFVSSRLQWLHSKSSPMAGIPELSADKLQLSSSLVLQSAMEVFARQKGKYAVPTQAFWSRFPAPVMGQSTRASRASGGAADEGNTGIGAGSLVAEGHVESSPRGGKKHTRSTSRGKAGGGQHTRSTPRGKAGGQQHTRSTPRGKAGGQQHTRSTLRSKAGGEHKKCASTGSDRTYSARRVPAQRKLYSHTAVVTEGMAHKNLAAFGLEPLGEMQGMKETFVPPIMVTDDMTGDEVEAFVKKEITEVIENARPWAILLNPRAFKLIMRKVLEFKAIEPSGSVAVKRQRLNKRYVEHVVRAVNGAIHDLTKEINEGPRGGDGASAPGGLDLAYGHREVVDLVDVGEISIRLAEFGVMLNPGEAFKERLKKETDLKFVKAQIETPDPAADEGVDVQLMTWSGPGSVYHPLLVYRQD